MGGRGACAWVPMRGLLLMSTTFSFNVFLSCVCLAVCALLSVVPSDFSHLYLLTPLPAGHTSHFLTPLPPAVTHTHTYTHSSVVRPFRHAATLTAAQLFSSWIVVSKGLSDSRNLTQAQLDAEEKKKGKVGGVCGFIFTFARIGRDHGALGCCGVWACVAVSCHAHLHTCFPHHSTLTLLSHTWLPTRQLSMGCAARWSAHTLTCAHIYIYVSTCLLILLILSFGWSGQGCMGALGQVAPKAGSFEGW